MQQTRWFCSSCEREWLYAYRWEPAQGCPACQSPEIELRTYTPEFAGADLPRDGTAAPAEVVDTSEAITAPPLVLTNDAIVETSVSPVVYAPRARREFDAMPELW